jgi:hypothetical protein
MKTDPSIDRLRARETQQRLNLQHIKGIVTQLQNRVEARDTKMDDPHGDGTGNDAQPPTGEDYNALLSDVRDALPLIMACIWKGEQS